MDPNELKDPFSRHGQNLPDGMLHDVANNVLLPIEEVKIWLQHLNSVAENRRRGAIKAAETRRIKSGNKADEYYCGTCEEKYVDEMSDVDFWIYCDFCHNWFCCNCELLTSPPSSEKYKCLKCQ